MADNNEQNTGEELPNIAEPSENAPGEPTENVEPIPINQPEPEPDKPAEKVIYRWNYSEALEKTPKTPSGKRGAAVFAIIMTVAFLLSFSALAITLILKPNTVYYDSGSQAVADMIEDVLDSVVIVSATKRTSISTGSGIVMSRDGYIITNAHVVNGAENVAVKFHNGKVLTAVVKGMSEWDDIAVLKVSGSDYHAASFADSSAIRAGESVYAIGAPEGADYGWSTTGGIISSATRYLKSYSETGIVTKRIKVIQTDAPVNSGNSGGPLIDAGGNVIGVVSMKLTSDSSENKTIENMGFALPINEVLSIVNEIIETGTSDNASSPLVTPRPLIGITGIGVEGGKYYVMQDNTCVEIDKSEIQLYEKNKVMAPKVSGVYVSAVSEGYDAANYLKPGDIIIAVNGIEVLTIYNVMSVINELSDGDKVTVKYYRCEQYYESTIELKYDTSVFD